MRAIPAVILLFGCFASPSSATQFNIPTTPDGSPVVMERGVVSAAFAGFFYALQEDRACGVKVVSGADVRPGDIVHVAGIVSTVGGERQVTAISVVRIADPATVSPLGLSIRDLGGKTLGFCPGIPGRRALYNIGLLVRVWGKVSGVTAGQMTLTDGAGECAVLLNGLTAPASGAFALVTGVSSVLQVDGKSTPLIRAVATSDGSELRLSVVGSGYVRPGGTVAVELRQTGLRQPSAGFQAFLGYPLDKLGTPAITVSEFPYGLELCRTTQGPEADIACGVDVFAGQSPSSADAVLATLVFQAPVDAPEGTARVTFRQHEPPSGLTDTDGNLLSGLALVDSPQIVIDATSPSISCPPDVSVAANFGLRFATGVPLGTPDVSDAGGVRQVSNDSPPRFPVGETAVIWTATDVAGNTASCVQTVRVTARRWFPHEIVFVGDSLIGAYFASSPDKGFMALTMAKLRSAYPGKTINYRSLRGDDGSMRTLSGLVRTYDGPWPDLLFIEDAATESNPMTGGSANGLARVIVDGGGGIAAASPDPAQPGSDYQYKYPGENNALGNLVTFRQGTNTSAGGLAKISPSGVPGSFTIQARGQGYDPSEPVEVLTDDWLGLARAALDDVLARWSNREGSGPPLVMFANLWLQSKAKVLYDGVEASWNDHWTRILTSPPYDAHALPVRAFETVSWEPWASGNWWCASTAGDTEWTLCEDLPFDPLGGELYLVDGAWAGKVMEWDGHRKLTLDKARGVARSGVYPYLAQWCPYAGRYGDGYHPTDAGHEALADALFSLIQAQIEESGE